MDNLKLGVIEKDALKEIGNIGAGNAVTALSKMIGKRIDMYVPIVSILPFNSVTSMIGGEENPVVGLFLRFDGDIEGNIMFILSKEDAISILNFFFTLDDNKDSFNDMEESALLELGNILAGSYIAALSNLTGFIIKCSVPSLSVDMAGAILSVPLILYGQIGDETLLIETRFQEGTKLLTGYFFMIPDPNSCKILLNKLGVIADE
jgi:chemotaxis protein CheC